MTTTSEAVTRGIRVFVTARYSPQNSDPASRRWVFLYTINVKNEGDETVQLVNRHWVITDANGEVEEVRGAGVVGKQPIVAPGESFEYTSGCPLETPFGSMYGTYEMKRVGAGKGAASSAESRAATEETFEVEVAPFALRKPGTMQ